MKLVIQSFKANSSHHLVELFIRNKTKLIWHFSDFLLITTNFESSQDGKEKGFVTFAERALETNWGLQSGPWPESEQRKGVDRPNPARRVAGGESEGARNIQQLEAHL